MTSNNTLNRILARISQIDGKLANLETSLTEAQDIIQIVYDEISKVKMEEEK
jgi:hypothetical protein